MDGSFLTADSVIELICSVLPASLDPLQFAYRSNRSTDDAICLHPAHCSLPPGK